MGDRIVVMKDGFIQQVDTPQNLYDMPCNVFVAGFIGTPQMNFINAEIAKEGDDLFVAFENCKFKLPTEKAQSEALKEYVGKEVILGVRPECIHDEPMYLSSLEEWTTDVAVDVTELMGAETYLYLTLGETNLISRVSSRTKAKSGDTIKVAFDISHAHIFDKETEKVIVH